MHVFEFPFESSGGIIYVTRESPALRPLIIVDYRLRRDKPHVYRSPLPPKPPPVPSPSMAQRELLVIKSCSCVMKGMRVREGADMA